MDKEILKNINEILYDSSKLAPPAFAPNDYKEGWKSGTSQVRDTIQRQLIQYLENLLKS